MCGLTLLTKCELYSILVVYDTLNLPAAYAQARAKISVRCSFLSYVKSPQNNIKLPAEIGDLLIQSIPINRYKKKFEKT